MRWLPAPLGRDVGRQAAEAAAFDEVTGGLVTSLVQGHSV